MSAETVATGYSGLSFSGQRLDARSLAAQAVIALALDRERARLLRAAGVAVAFVRPRWWRQGRNRTI